MPETLLSPSNILLYGRVLADVLLEHPAAEANNPGQGPDEPVPDPPQAPPKLGENRFLQRQLTAHADDENRSPRLARIYGFSYEGHYYDLARPAIFLVHGPGNDPEAFRPGAANNLEIRGDRAPADADRTGIAYTASSFSHDIKVWSYDKGDFSIRLDPDSGPLEQILLLAELEMEGVQTQYSGQKT
jgi:hypothetical protein